ncbi:AarF/ABC1/UbiB kinase family protein [Kaistella flava (ex Peng et al. 2021)]|uniref:AarF/ABC1/UbiB kinase family protein n=1 Tax=Kaistella flava (ex Peng et al. 2021) TaxID=2038776 RepID=A0A7M2Y7V7_9FLAO|nr:AarF/UbiB family protein [Kaistella flava (ex Peng et al. 2021)]QOW10348.1 AarF/ABC1/UbiB kinase family protein [Kaistella flava (ex Peng et al. 2021)]
MFDKQQRKLKRSAKLISIFSKYGFKDILARMNLAKNNEPSVDENEIVLTNSVYERIRMTLEELGPTFVKLGQAFSSREDLLPTDLILELQKLQDKVEEVDLNLEEILEQEFNISPYEHFKEIQKKPVATASIAQVYKAILNDGSEVILKVKKPNVQEIIQDDLLLIHDLIKVISTYSDIGVRFNLKSAISTFEKSLLEEISLTNEKNNIQQFALNFKNNKETYVPKVYEEFCSNNILCMEFIDGLKITDKEALLENEINPVKISEVGLRLFVSQILDYGFFHADPHAGNILITKDGKVVFIDFGAVGKIQPNDKEILEQLIVAFVSKNAAKIVKNLKKMAVSYEIPDEKEFQNDVEEVLNFVHHTSLQNIDVPKLVGKMIHTLKNNRLNMPDYLYLLLKGISLIEGVGRSINPNLDIVKSLRPFTKKIIFNKISPEKLVKSGSQKLLNLIDNVEEIPKELRSLLEKLDENKFTITSEIKDLEKTHQLIKSSIVNLVLTLVLCSNIIATAILWNSERALHMGDITLLIILSVIFSVVLAIVLFLRLLKR